MKQVPLRSAGGRQSSLNMTPEQRSERARKASLAAWSRLTPEQRAIRTEKMRLARSAPVYQEPPPPAKMGRPLRGQELTPEQRKEHKRLSDIRSSLNPEVREKEIAYQKAYYLRRTKKLREAKKNQQ